MARRYEFCVLVARTIFHSFAALTREILILPLEHKIHIFSPPCIILYIFSLFYFGSDRKRGSLGRNASMRTRSVVGVPEKSSYMCLLNSDGYTCNVDVLSYYIVRYISNQTVRQSQSKTIYPGLALWTDVSQRLST